MYDIEIVSDNDEPDYEIWTCKNCGRTVTVNRGGDVAFCPCEFDEEPCDAEDVQAVLDDFKNRKGNKAKDDLERDRQEALNDRYERMSQQVGGYDTPCDE